MKLNKKFLSLLLAFAMIFSCFADIISVAASSLPKEKTEELKGVKKGNKLEFAFEIPQNESAKGSAYTTDGGLDVSAYGFEAQGAGQNDTEIELITKGLNGAEFDWSALPGSEFKLIAKWNTTDGQSHEKPIGPITKDGVREFNVDWPVDGTLKGNAVLQSEYDQNIGIRVQFTPANSQGYGGKFKFKVTLEELAESRVDVKYVDPYGRELTDKADFPTGTMPKVTAEELQDVSIDLPKTSGQINMRADKDNLDLDDLHSASDGLTYKVDGQGDEGTVTIGGKDYKLEISQPNAKDIATILLAYQKDVVIPPTKDDGSGKPVDVADGYVRLTFDANENKQDGIKGTHQAGAYARQQKSYIDVKSGVQYDNANLQAAIKELSTKGTKDVNGETKTFAQKAKAPWTPAVPTDTTPVTTATYNAQYEKSAAEQVTELGGLNPVTIKVWKGDKIDWVKGVAPATTNTDDRDLVQGLLDNAKVTDQSSRSSANAGKFPGKLKITFDEGSSLEVDKQMLIVSEHVVVIDPNNTDPDAPQKEDLPRDKITVIFKAGEGIVNINTNGKTTYAKPNATLADTDFPTNITYKDGYKNEVTWEPTDHKVDTNNRKYYNGKRNTFTFTATAEKEKTTAEKVKNAGGLENKDFGVFVGTDVNAKDFWKKGVQVATSVTDTAKKTEIQGYLDNAKTTFADMSSRTTDQENLNPTAGKIKVTFEDGSFIEVENQKLYVWAKKTENNDDNKDKPKPADAVQVSFEKGTGVTALDPANKTMTVKSGTALVDADFPQATVDEANGYKKPATWSGQTANNPKDYTVTENNKKFTATASSNVPTTTNSEDYDPHYTGKSGKPGETVQIDAPKFTKKGVTGNVPAPNGTKFANNDPNQTNVTVDPNTGAITVAIPQDAPVGSTITIAVDVTYPDRSNETVEVTVTVSDNTQPKPEEDKSKTPIVDPVNDGDTSISGKGEPGSDIIINIPGKDPIKTTVDDGGRWIAPIDPAHEGDVIKVVQKEVGKKPSDPAYVTVGGRSIIVPSHDDDGHWWFGGGSFKPVETEEQVIDKTEHGIHIAYIFGYKDHTFRCEGKITRAEAASMIAHIAKLDLSDNSKPDFKDTPSSWYNAAINAMVKKNLMFADKNGNFRPNEPITRGEFARAIQFIDKENKKEAPFMDIKGHEFEEAINQAYANGRIAGYPDGTFKPDESITRAEAVTILNNFDGRMVRERGIEDVKKDLIKFTDLKPSHWAYYEIIEASNSHAYSRISNDSKEEKWSNLIK